MGKGASGGKRAENNNQGCHMTHGSVGQTSPHLDAPGADAYDIPAGIGRQRGGRYGG